MSTLEFPESIVPVIAEAAQSDLDVLARILESTTITRNHDAIAKAWLDRMADVRMSKDPQCLATYAAILAQKPSQESVAA